jgi:hypothetical protein
MGLDWDTHVKSSHHSVPEHSGLFGQGGWYRISKAFDLIPHDRLPTKLLASGVDSRVVIWVREFLVGYIQQVRVGKSQIKTTQKSFSRIWTPWGNGQ